MTAASVDTDEKILLRDFYGKLLRELSLNAKQYPYMEMIFRYKKKNPEN